MTYTNMKKFIILNKTPAMCPYNWTMIDVRCATITCLTKVLVKSRVAIMASLIEKGVWVHMSVIICHSWPGLVPYTPFSLKLQSKLWNRFGTLYNILQKIIIKVMTEVRKFVFKTKVRMSIWIIWVTVCWTLNGSG